MTRIPRPIIALAAFLAAGALRAEDTIKVGEYASLTGKEASFGQSSHKGITMAIEEINAAGGVLGRSIELITEDNQTVAGQSGTVVRKLIARDRVVALLGEVSSGRSLEAAPIAHIRRARESECASSTIIPARSRMGASCATSVRASARSAPASAGCATCGKTSTAIWS